MLHRRAAAALGELHPKDVDSVASRIAQHYEEADQPGLAIDYYRRASLAAQDSHANREAIALARRAIALLRESEADPPTERELLELLADSLAATGQLAEAETMYRRALDSPSPMSLLEPASRIQTAELQRKLAKALSERLYRDEAEDLYDSALASIEDLRNTTAARPVWLHCQIDRLDLYYMLNRVDEMAHVAAEIEPAVRDLDDPYIKSIYHKIVSKLRIRQERFRLSPDTVQLVREYLDYTIALGDSREVAEQQFGLGFTLLWAGELDEAAGYLQAALTSAEELDHPFLQVRCLTYLGILYRLRRDPEGVRRFLKRSEQFSGDDKYRYYVGVDHAQRAWLAFLVGEWPTAVTEAQDALQLWDDGIYVFGWLAHWILMAHDWQAGRLEYSGQAATEMLSPQHQRLPDEITAALEEVRQAIDSGNPEATSVALERALSLAQDEGYL
jgi:tetratricopeptide (TPR) repeat protein